MKSNGLRVAVVGAGMGGLACAAALRRLGLDAIVFEQAAEFRRIGAGIQVTPNAVKALRGLGLENRIRALGFEAARGYNREAGSAAITNQLELGDKIIERCGASLITMHRGDLHSALLSALPTDAVVMGRRLTHYTQNADFVELAFEGGSVERADMLVAADGVHSVVRDQIFGAQPPKFTGRVAYRTTFPASLIGDLEIDERCKWWGADRHIVIYFTTRRKDEIYFVTSTPEPDFTVESWSAKGDLAELQSAYRSFHPTVRAVIAACPEAYKWALVVRDPLPTWSQGRVVLLGDACHPMTPYMAQGAASAIEDAVILARSLHDSRVGGLQDAIRVYESVRRPRATAIQQNSAENTWMRNATSFEWVYGYDAWADPMQVSSEPVFN